MLKNIVFFAAFAGLLCAAAPAKRAPKRSARPVQADPYYLGGLDLYARGETKQALTAFHEALERHPGDPVLVSAINRVKADLTAEALRRAAPPPVEPTWSDSFDDFLTQAVPSFISFDETLGDADAAQGSMSAIQGRVAQLLAEKKSAAARRRPFGKDQELRALVRRLPTLTA